MPNRLPARRRPLTPKRTTPSPVDGTVRSRRHAWYEAGTAPLRTKTRDGHMVTTGRLAVPHDVKLAMPRGFAPKLDELDEFNERKYEDVPVRWFKEHEDELLTIVRTHISPVGFGTPPIGCTFRAKLALQKWMLGRLENERMGADGE